MRVDATVPFTYEDDENVLEYYADLQITSYGSAPSWDDPGDPPEYEYKIFDPDSNEIKDTDPLYKALEIAFLKEMDNFDWPQAERDEDAYQAELSYDEYRDRDL